jgi:hypothetical protein
MASSPSHDQFAQLRRRLRHFDLEVRHVAKFARHLREKRRREGRARNWRVLDHDRDIDGIRDLAVELVDASLAHPDRRAVIGRHDHDHGGAGILRGPAAQRTLVRAEMRGGNDDRHASSNVFEHHVDQAAAFVVGKGELLGEIGEDAQAVGACIDHEVDAAFLAFEVEAPVLFENGRRDRKNAAIGCRAGYLCHVSCALAGGLVVSRSRISHAAGRFATPR